MFGIESIDLSSKDIDNDMFSKRFDRGMKKYPMLEVCCFPTWNDDHKKIIADYIDSLENKVEVYA
jgi:hypothetical protein